MIENPEGSSSLRHVGAERKDVLVAPQEVRELLRRLTEYSIEGPSAEEPRTLGGLAAQTGIPIERLEKALAKMRRKWPNPGWLLAPAACIAIVFVIVHNAHPPVSVAPVEVPYSTVEPAKMDDTGLVPSETVSYGQPGIALADPSFEPVTPLPLGLAVFASTSGVLWGTGDDHAEVIDRGLTSAERALLVKTAEDLLEHSFRQALKRHVPPVSPSGSAPQSEPHYTFNLGGSCYRGTGTTQAILPLDSDPSTLKAIIRHAARQMVDNLDQQVKASQSADELTYRR